MPLTLKQTNLKSVYNNNENNEKVRKTKFILRRCLFAMAFGCRGIFSDTVNEIWNQTLGVRGVIQVLIFQRYLCYQPSSTHHLILLFTFACWS